MSMYSTFPTPPTLSTPQDLVIPSYKGPSHYRQSMYMGRRHPGGEQQVRDIFIFFRGDVGRQRDDKDCVYSR